ncbi:14379_t:CDS:2, partial [Entrophospora sp. SA101]
SEQRLTGNIHDNAPSAYASRTLKSQSNLKNPQVGGVMERLLFAAIDINEKEKENYTNNSEFKFYNDLDVIFDANEANDFIKDIDTCIKLDNGYGYNPLYNPQLRKYLDNTWWKTVVFWSNLIPPIKDRTQRTTATVEFWESIGGGIVVDKKQMNTSLQEVLIIKAQVESKESQDSNNNFIKAIQIPPTMLQDPKYTKKTDFQGKKAPLLCRKILYDTIEVAYGSVICSKYSVSVSDKKKLSKPEEINKPQQIIPLEEEYVLAGGRENIQFGEVDDETKNHQQDYAKHEKMILPLRSSLQSVFSIRWFIFTIPPPVAKTHLHPSITIDFDGSLRGGKKPISPPKWKSYMEVVMVL